MNSRRLAAAALLWTGAVTSSIAQSDLGPSPGAKNEAPRLAAIMSAAQLQHLKLWFAGKASNWDLAAYELRQLTDSLGEAAMLYPGIPVSNITTMRGPLVSVSDAISAGDARQFAAAMRGLTDGCNGCHSSMDRSFVVMILPTNQAAPANQRFAPAAKSRKP